MGSQYSSKRESFHDAILKKDLKKVKYFIQNGLDVKNDLRALELATYRGSTDIVEYLLHRGCKPNNKRTARAFDIAVWKCHKEIAQLFLKAGIEYKGKNIYQETILFVAACSNNIALTEILIESGCDMNETTRYWSPLHAAAARNHEQTLETLVI
jgi:ankyrin repeat protein